MGTGSIVVVSNVFNFFDDGSKDRASAAEEFETTHGSSLGMH